MCRVEDFVKRKSVKMLYRLIICSVMLPLSYGSLRLPQNWLTQLYDLEMFCVYDVMAPAHSTAASVS